ncbi:MarR family winged helix-turn-helix transcriptional regulator [Deinococcus sp. HMF7604]|uniref:MarR family winged helix-turn-helix transcriptional regulator n=1 Tax=Deinococcus betulae TaxID=2873312 RepID=UPI001CC8F571|nr:MarR family transcriptional regulator [Deinococcus betulae]MBZ9753365.1 MarR family winged helix-turn-helix transcriptional regulator [Deinococcus betulae]
MRPGFTSPAQAPPAPDLTTQPLRFLAAYWAVWQHLSGHLQTALEQGHGLDVRSFIALSYVQAAPLTPAELASHLRVPRYEVTRVLRHLESRKAIDRHPAPHDARSHRLCATPAGRTLWQAALHTVETVTTPALHALSPTPLDILTASLETLAATPLEARP